MRRPHPGTRETDNIREEYISLPDFEGSALFFILNSNIRVEWKYHNVSHKGELSLIDYRHLAHTTSTYPDIQILPATMAFGPRLALLLILVCLLSSVASQMLSRQKKKDPTCQKIIHNPKKFKLNLYAYQAKEKVNGKEPLVCCNSPKLADFPLDTQSFTSSSKKK